MNTTADEYRQTLIACVKDFGSAGVLCVGDMMLDHFTYGEVIRISPESPVPVLNVKRQQSMLGGAGNTLRNLTSLGAQARIVSVIGNDPAGQTVTRLLEECGDAEPLIECEQSRPTSVKNRFVAQGQQLLRADTESTLPIEQDTFDRLIDRFSKALPSCSAVLLSDYAKGVLAGDRASEFIRLARDAGKPVIVDPKGVDFSRYRGATLLKPNLKEFHEASGCAGESDKEIVAASRRLLDACGAAFLLITRGSDGMLLVSDAGESWKFPTLAREVFDVSGAGDTAAAALSCAMALGAPVEQATEIANIAAGLAVGKAGTATVDQSELLDCLSGSNVNLCLAGPVSDPDRD